MALELSELAAGLPMAVSLALAGGFSGIREGHRRAVLNEAVHEVRRPLQALVLTLPDRGEVNAGFDSSLRMAAIALEKLEREINGGAASEPTRAISLRSLAEDAVARWHLAARRTGKSLSLKLEVGAAVLWGVESDLSQALDNLISNGLRHGGRDVVIEVEEQEGRLLLAVCDSGGGVRTPTSQRAGKTVARILRRSPHGHGLRIVRRIAAGHGGSFELRTQAEGTRAVISLPSGRVDE